jgi:hypothetical protein
MSNTIDEQTFIEINKIITLHLKSKSSISQTTLNRVKSLIYFNNQSGDLKALKYYYVKTEFFNALINSYFIQDKSLFKILLDLASKFNNPHNQKNIFYNSDLEDLDSLFEFLMKCSDNDIINILNSVYAKNLEQMHYWKIHKLIYLLQQNKKYTALSHLCDPKQNYHKYITEQIKNEFPFYKDGIGTLMSPTQTSQINPNNVILALLHNDITTLNIFLRLNPNLLKHFKFDEFSFINNEAMVYLKIVYAQNLKYVQNLFTFRLNEDLNQDTGERIKNLIKNMDFIKKEQLLKGKFHQQKEKTTKESILDNSFHLLSYLNKLFTKKKSNTTDVVIEKEVILESQKLDNETVAHYFQFMYELNLDTLEKNSLLHFEQLILDILNIGQMSVKIKCDILLILQDKLPKLTQTYLELTQTDPSKKMVYLDAYINAIDLLSNQFNLYYEELMGLKKQTLALNFTEQIVFLEKKYLTSSNGS